MARNPPGGILWGGPEWEAWQNGVSLFPLAAPPVAPVEPPAPSPVAALGYVDLFGFHVPVLLLAAGAGLALWVMSDDSGKKRKR